MQPPRSAPDRSGTTTNSAGTRTPEQREREQIALRKLLGELDAAPVTHEKPLPRDPKKQSRNIVRDLRERMRHRRDLRRARKAARKTFGINTRPSARKRAALMMGMGAMTLSTAATSYVPVTMDKRSNQAVVQPVKADPTIQRVNAAEITSSDAFKQALIEEEGVRQTVYRDVAGYPTVGVGHLIRPGDGLNVGDRISYDQVLDFLEEDLAIAEEGVRRLVGDLPLFQHEFDALVDLVYNVGEGNVSERKSPRLNAAIQSGDYDAIADELDYTTAGGKKARGLEFRSDRRAAMFQQASYENPRDA